MSRVVVIILHAEPGPAAGPLEAGFADARRKSADRQARGFAELGATVEVVATSPSGPGYGPRLRALAEAHDLARAGTGSGLIVLGSGSIPLARRPDRALFVAAATGTWRASTKQSRNPADAADRPAMLVNNRFSADILAVPAGADLGALPDVASDNGLPRWAAAHGMTVRDLHARWRLQVDLDSPLDVELVSDPRRQAAADAFPWTRTIAGVLQRVRGVAANPGAEVLVAGRSSSTTLRWVEEHTASRTRALIEERGMKTAGRHQRPVRSTLGLLLDRDGPDTLATLIEALADAAVIDTRVLMAHRFGRDELAWPTAEDRFASDLLLHDRIADPWLRALTASAAGSRVPIVLGGHTLVGPGLRLALRAPAADDEDPGSGQ